MATIQSDKPRPPPSFLDKVEAWGSSSLPPMGLATLVTALHFRPLQPFPLLFAPALMFASYVSISGWAIDGAGLSMAASGIYTLLALRRRGPASLRGRFSARGFVRGAAIGLGAANAVAGGWVYFTADRKREAADRLARNRWGGPTPK